MLGIYQKGLSTTPASHDQGRVLSFCLKPLQPLAASVVPLRVKQAKELKSQGMTAINIAVGTLEIK